MPFCVQVEWVDVFIGPVTCTSCHTIRCFGKTRSHRRSGIRVSSQTLELLRTVSKPLLDAMSSSRALSRVLPRRPLPLIRNLQKPVSLKSGRNSFAPHSLLSFRHFMRDL